MKILLTSVALSLLRVAKVLGHLDDKSECFLSLKTRQLPLPNEAGKMISKPTFHEHLLVLTDVCKVADGVYDATRRVSYATRSHMHTGPLVIVIATPSLWLTRP